MFEYSIDPLTVEAVKTSKPSLIDGDEVRTLAFIVRDSLVLILLVKLPKKTKKSISSGSAPILWCRVWNEWKSFSDYLAVMRTALEPTAIEPKTGNEGWQQQQRWWSENGKAFRIMDLPAELRIMILKEAIGRRFYPKCSEHNLPKPFWYLGEGYEGSKYGRSGWSDPYKEVVRKPNVTALLAHPKLYDEMEHYIQYEAQRGFDSILDLRLWVRLDQLHSPGGMDSLQSLQLDSSHEEYVKFFGVEVAPFQPEQPAPANLFSELSNLQSLELRFRSPLNGATDDPWGVKGRFNGYETDRDYHGNRLTNFRTSCQRTIVDWILTFAKQWIEHIPRISFTGCIKTSTKTKWNLILTENRKAIDLGFDIEAAKARIRNWPKHDLPPTCHCSNLCAYSGASVSKHLIECEKKNCATCRNCVNEPDEKSPNKVRRSCLEDYVFDFED